MAHRKPVRVVLIGAGGRMGAALIPQLAACPEIELTGTMVSTGDPRVGRGVVELPVLSYRARWPDEGADVAIDFTRADAFDAVLEECVRRRCALVSGTTGLSAEQQGALDQAARRIPVMWSANFSVGMAVLRRLVSTASATLPDYDCEIVEIHHRGKRDAPSGSAHSLGETVAEARRVPISEMAIGDTRAEGGAIARAQIGMHSLRLGESIGEHSVLFASESERLELTHRVSERGVFARGAVRAAIWLAGRPAGSYRIDDLLGAP